MYQCKRMVVVAEGFDGDRYARTTNTNERLCTGEEGRCGCTHAEANLLKVMPSPKLVILSHSPCLDCATMLAAVGVKQVVYRNQYRKTEGIQYLRERGILIQHYPLDDQLPI